jgi:hypothetical protein
MNYVTARQHLTARATHVRWPSGADGGAHEQVWGMLMLTPSTQMSNGRQCRGRATTSTIAACPARRATSCAVQGG